ncbi:unnamed protein product [Fusarium graminearum]|uniref:Chromosome 2, complete genome n=1 Tax=Gibberella zeae (strain ATCC MYA-4620 / CBS 123657 / FGSC 9075 / NRRL 31084 / PH-1) TaxID=229533 RepID=I1S976_GIBZE|nr:hypothetical protein FGSG_13406 [Fusarium graminearum PH-1]ESU15106.1 hypothetical protein FGSG_13406 [Fusarium graminearum PH-1]CAF3491376.1 unnamed protein product [Fusarium graminearum]CEF76562.1 unnamed protein product [Fusarium graminearum]CZS79855.1 unnamed protein product [Fusarium graminearum]|eukprot:XP_011320531.1 hypothetical protein FGSG_13406 [Fusarium graminearum PH-1]
MPVLNVHIEHNVGTQMAFNGIKGYSKQKDIPDRINGTEEEDILRVALLTGLGLWMPFPEDPLEMLLWLVSDWLTPLGDVPEHGTSQCPFRSPIQRAFIHPTPATEKRTKPSIDSQDRPPAER